MRFKHGLAAAFAALALGLSACEGDDGAAGAPGSQGPQGPEGPRGSGEVLLDLSLLGRYASDVFDDSAAEIVAYDPSTRRAFVINAAATSVDVLNVADPTAPVLLQTIDASAEGAGANSVAVFGGVAAVAIEAEPKTDPGKVVFYDTTSLLKIGEAAVGALPDMLTFTPDGAAVLVANEGEPNEGYAVDPVGSVSVIDVRQGFANPPVATAGFAAFNGQADALRAAGVRIYGPGASVAQDLEPEYIAVAPDGRSAWVSLQEANAAAVLDLGDLSAPVVTRLIPFGLKDHSILGNELDASDRDGRINIRNWPVKGIYQPDALAAYSFNGKTYYVTANEGDDRNDFIPGEETARVRALIDAGRLDPEVFPDQATLRDNAMLGRLTVSTLAVPQNQAGQFTELHALGARSFSIWSEDGTQMYDSGADFERITARRYPDNFNASNDENDAEGRSDNKGPEPEGVVVGQIGGRSFAFIGLERIGGVMVYDVSNPQNARFVQYVNTRDFDRVPGDDPGVGELGPEGLSFVPAADSQTGAPMLIVGNEVSGTTAFYRIDVIELD
jgi:DNA-binding beta-propeller fold protein YncE